MTEPWLVTSDDIAAIFPVADHEACEIFAVEEVVTVALFAVLEIAALARLLQKPAIEVFPCLLSP